MLRPWELNIAIVRDSSTAIHVQIALKIIEEIQNGRFTPGSVLPGTREFASKINVNRKTVIQAYDELVAQGWLTAESKRGTFISDKQVANSTAGGSPSASNGASTKVLTVNLNNRPILDTHQLSLRNTLPKEVTPILSKRQMHDFIHLSDGLPDARLIPLELLSRAMRHALIVSARNNKLAYGDPKGALFLREALVHMLNMERGLHAKVNNICAVRGSQMGIYVVAKVLIQQGNCVVVEQLGNTLAREAFKNCGATILSVKHDEEGIDVENLEQLCRQQYDTQYKVRAVYVTPHHHLPTTVTMSEARRQRLLALADQYDFLIIEDDNDHEFNFSQSPVLPIASMQHAKRVIYIGSLSKVLTAGFRIGYVVASEEIINLCANQVMLIDRQGNQITELAVAELLHTGEIKRHTLRTQKIYALRRTYVANLIRQELGEYVTFKLAVSGLAIWLVISPEINIKTLVGDAEAQKVRFQAGKYFSHHGNEIQAIRMGFANLNDDEITQGILRLKHAFINQQLKLLSA